MACAQLVPFVEPRLEAVGEFARLLGGALAPRLGQPVPLVGADQLAVRNATTLLETLERDGGVDRLLVHYVNYGYSQDGCPDWLIEGLERWRSRGTRRLVTIFHEVYASGPPWTRSFWSGPRQRRLAGRLLRASDGAVTSLPAFRQRLRGLGGDAVLLPVFSTCGEPARLTEISERPRRLVVLGSAGNRANVYRALQRLERVVTTLDVEAIEDIGESIDAPSHVGHANVNRLGCLTAADVSARLLVARAGCLGYEPGFVARSTTYAAYAAHGLVPVALGRAEPSADEAAPVWSPRTEPAPSSERLSLLAAAAHAAYAKHDLAAHATLHARLLSVATAHAS